jgi:hypothetical protein
MLNFSVRTRLVAWPLRSGFEGGYVLSGIAGSLPLFSSDDMCQQSGSLQPRYMLH